MKRYRDIAGDGGSNIVGQVEAQQARLGERLRQVRAIVAVVSGKGGVGKSSITANLAGAFALAGVARGRAGRRSQRARRWPRCWACAVARWWSAPAGVEPPAGALGIRVMSMDLLLAGDATPLTWDAPSQAEAHTWRGTMEANALREFLADTAWGALDVLLIDLPPGTDRLATIVGTGARAGRHRDRHHPLRRLAPGGGPVDDGGAGGAGAGARPDREHGGDVPGRRAPRGWPATAGCRSWVGVPFDPGLAAAADRGEPYVAVAPESPAARALCSIADRLRQTLARRSAREGAVLPGVRRRGWPRSSRTATGASAALAAAGPTTPTRSPPRWPW